jgi:hypothetical protein
MEENHFIDADQFDPTISKDGLKFRDIVLHHFQKISRFASVEFRGGHWEIKKIPIHIGGTVSTITNKFYVNDTREIYSNAVECLADLLAPYFDEEMIEAEKRIKEKMEIAFNKTTKEQVDNGEDENKSYRIFENDKKRITYRDVRVKLNRELFRSLSEFLCRINYLEKGIITD